MISSDQNIENIASFVEEAKEWLYIKSRYTKLDIIDKLVRILTAVFIAAIIAVVLMLVLIYLSFAAAYYIDELIGYMPLSFLAVSFFYLLFLFILYKKRHSWIARPLVRFLVSILISNNNKA